MAIRTVTIEVKMDISNAEGKIATLTGSMKVLGDEVKKTGKSTDDFERLVTKNMQEGESAFQSLTRRSKELHAEIDGLKRSFGGARTGTEAKSILGDLNGAQNDLKKIKSFLGDMADEGEKAGKSYFSKFILSFRSLPEFLSGLVSNPIGIGVLAAATVAITSAVSAAVAAGVGLGVIGAGAFILKNDARVQAAFAPLKTDLVNVFTSAAQPMVKPIVDALGSVDKFIKSEQPAFTSLFSAAAPAIGLITKGLEGLVSELLPALTKDAQAFTDSLQNPGVQKSLKAAGDGLVRIFAVIGENPKVVAAGFHVIDGAIELVAGTIRGLVAIVGPLIDGLNEIANFQPFGSSGTGGKNPQKDLEELAKQPVGFNTGAAAAQRTLAIQGITKAFDEGKISVKEYNGLLQDLGVTANGVGTQMTALISNIASAAKAAVAAAPNYAELSQTLGATTVTASTLAGQLTDKVMGAMLAVDNANNNFNKSLITVGDTIVALGGNLTQHVKALKKTETGQQQETDAVLAAITANLQVYDAQIAAGVGADDAAKAYAGNARQLDAQVRSAGKVPKAVQALIDKYSKVPTKVNTIIAMQGLTTAINNLDETLRLINGLSGRTANIYVTTHYKTLGRPPGQARPSRWGNVFEGGYQHADIGLTSAGIYAPPTKYAFAEPATGGEAFIPRLGDYGRSMSIIQAAAGWYNAHVVPNNSVGAGGGLYIEISFAPGAPSVLRDLVRVAVKETGQGVVKALTPR